MLGTSTPDQVASAVLRAMAGNLPEVIVNPGPMRLSLSFGTLFPRFNEWASERIGAHDVFTGAILARRKGA